VLDGRKTQVGETRLAKKAPLLDADVKALLASVDEVVVAKGKSARTLAARDATLEDLKGPTGSYRAPILKAGRRLLVGFNEAALAGLLGTR